MDTSQFDDLLSRLEDAAVEAIRPAAQAGANVIYEEARRLAGRSTKPHFFYGKSWKKGSESKEGRYRFNPGTLQKAIYQVYSKDNSSPTRATYHVSWNYEKAPYGLFVEYGLNPFAPDRQPFLRPALVNKYKEALAAAEGAIMKKLGEL
jgi:hypothetical protein